MSSGIPLPPCGHEWAETTEWCRVRCPQVAPPAATTTEATEHRADAPHMGPRMGKEQRFFASILIEEEATIPTVNPRRNHGVQVAVTAEPAPTAASWRFGDKTASPTTNTRWLRL